jgi:23S rRNA pseudouridine2605 synthase
METKKRLSKALAAAGIASRRGAEDLIFAGKVSVNGIIVKVPQTLVSWEKDVICVDKVPVTKEESKLYFLLNKPRGYICSNARVGTKKIVSDLFEDVPERLFTIGRLDRDTTGLLLVTNDGNFANRVIHPSANITKEYLVRTHSEPFHEQLLQISKGIEIVTKVRKGTLKVVVREGKKREVRLLVEQTGLKVLELKRIRIGGLLLGDIPEGAYRVLTEAERESIFR